MTLKNAIASSLVIALGVILIVHFALFWVYGGVFIYESNKIVLAIETGMSIGIIMFGIERLVHSASTKEEIESVSGSRRPSLAQPAGSQQAGWQSLFSNRNDGFSDTASTLTQTRSFLEVTSNSIHSSGSSGYTQDSTFSLS